ncbi:2,3-bisphosphoglycerate-dependent phosphoglycerate mutase [Clavibacter michiganensis]|uniref:2,3-bisphosphoglycerate-dependent phosphoglycerate mutase n=1 Tax=Clavibacter michiganensis TaxID=28447 RepID=UPI001957EB62|nr:2,3-diphosphoglycerate-dependent phosphoglycerate mutase [Clavibacter michiganensis]MBM7412360.1 2,3-bisphosphoglycerate-dependent phosphoglycerate mutase [Clavibacter michiganensis]
MTGLLVLLRHGQSAGDTAGRFAGLRDVPLTASGAAEASRAGARLARAGIAPDLVLTSTLQRATHTAELVTDALGRDVPTHALWRLNERDHGALTGRRQDDVRRELGDDRVDALRGSLDARPPRMPVGSWVALWASPALRGLPMAAITRAESLGDVVHRVRPVLDDRIAPELRRGRTVLVVGHGDSLRALALCIDHLTEPELARLELPAAQPVLHRLDADGRPFPRGGAHLDPASQGVADALTTDGAA